MREWLTARHRGLFIRSYMVLAGGLLIAAIVLDLGFDALQSRQERAADPFLVSTFRTLESTLAATPEAERDARATELATKLGLQIELLESGEISGASPEPVPHELENDDGKIFYLWNSSALNGRGSPLDSPSIKARRISSICALRSCSRRIRSRIYSLSFV